MNAPAEPLTEIEVMLEAWRTGTPAARDVALQMAEDNRIRAERTPDRLSRRCLDAVARALIAPTNASKEPR